MHLAADTLRHFDTTESQQPSAQEVASATRDCDLATSVSNLNPPHPTRHHGKQQFYNHSHSHSPALAATRKDRTVGVLLSAQHRKTFSTPKSWNLAKKAPNSLLIRHLCYWKCWFRANLSCAPAGGRRSYIQLGTDNATPSRL